MKYRKLGHTDLNVSLIGLGTMTWGQQNTEAQGHQQLDAALSAGVNFIDTAEMYSVPPDPKTYGSTEKIIGTWLQKHNNRSQVILATKAAGPAKFLPQAQSAHIRGGVSHFNRKNLELALEGSLQRLKTDYIDLYQLHWPDRNTNYFGRLGYKPIDNEDTVPILETLEVLADFVKAGKVRHIGVSNETPWGLVQFLNLAEKHSLPRVVSIQNPYNLLNRTFEIGLAEFAHREQVGLLAYSPLAFGVLTGKYLNGAKPHGARITLFERFVRYNSRQAEKATAAYVQLAQNHGYDPAQLALAFINSQPFVASNLIGATTLEQLQSNLDSIHLDLPEELLEKIEAIHIDQPNPCP